MQNSDVIQKLAEVAFGNLDKASFKALLRLQIFFTGRTHELILEFGKRAQTVLLKHGGSAGLLDGSNGFHAQIEILKLWGDMFKMWQEEFLSARREAASLPYGVMAIRHEQLIRPMIGEQLPVIGESIVNGVFEPQIDVLLNAAGEHLFGDGMNLSSRIWRIDGAGRDAINNAIMQGIADGDSAWNIAKKLEQYLGAGENCPRWTSTRLYDRTAKEKASGDTGLLSGNDCDGSGVSYKALRLARTEIQKAHALATDKVMMSQPWVEKEQCHLSAAHPEPDECDDVITNGESGKGIYAVGTVEYPLHPGCFCYKTAVLMDQQAFTSQLNGWLKGESWPEMDSYSTMIGGDMNVSLMPNSLSLAVWLLDDNLSSVFGAKRLGF